MKTWVLMLWMTQRAITVVPGYESYEACQEAARLAYTHVYSACIPGPKVK